MGKNSQIHLFIDSEALLKLRQQADRKGITLSELCRQKLQMYDQLEKIEFMISKIINKNGK